MKSRYNVEPGLKSYNCFWLFHKRDFNIFIPADLKWLGLRWRKIKVISQTSVNQSGLSNSFLIF